MNYLLSVHTAEGPPQREPTPEEMRQSYAAIGALEEEMKAAGAFLLSGRLTGPESARVVRASEGEVLTTDGPFIESKELLGGFYIIEADDLDGALGWASKVSATIRMPIEVRPFAGLAGG